MRRPNVVIDQSRWVPLPRAWRGSPRRTCVVGCAARRGGVRGGGAFGTGFPPPGSVLRTSPPSPPLVQVGCFRLGPIDKWPNPGTPGFDEGRVSALAVRESIRQACTLCFFKGSEEIAARAEPTIALLCGDRARSGARPGLRLGGGRRRDRARLLGRGGLGRGGLGVCGLLGGSRRGGRAG